ncbi:MAG TPA: energy transducer TonB [Candidatus Acidoferrales bacterium]|nr:energy transducer TonB [Candidatus Acidoferrales bacterium]
MKRIARVPLVAILLVVALCFASPASAQNQSPDELISKARNAISPSLMGPHHLEAEVKVRLSDGTKGKGSYSLDWAAPDRFREEIHLPGYDEIKVGSGTTLYRKRSADYIPPRVFELEMLMNPTADLDQFQTDISQLLHEPGFKASSKDQAAVAQLAVSRIKIGDGEATCISPTSGVPEACFDPGHGWPLEVTEDIPETEERLTFSNYASLGHGHVPRERRFSENGATTIEARVKKLSSGQQFDADTFAPPAGAEQIPWCSDMVPPVRQTIKTQLSLSADDLPEPEFLYGVVGADGTLRRFSIIESDGPKADAAVRSIAESIHFAPATCGGKPVQSESRFVLSDMDFIPSTYSGDVPEASAKGFTHPDCEHCPTPPFTDAAFDHKIRGTVILSAIIAPDGRAHDIRILKRLGYGLEESAVRCVRSMWRFKPATGPDGKPAAVHTLIEVDFNIY